MNTGQDSAVVMETMVRSSIFAYRNVAPSHSVFLSHSGAQKNFVEQLYVDLESCNRSVFFDICSDSLPKGEPFSQHIFRAIQQCQVGVVVLTEEFFSSKWPMLELVEMCRTTRLSDSRLKIMPIFLGVTPGECRDEANYRRWLAMWCEWAREDKRIEVEEWEEALKLLGPINGFTYKVGVGEVKFREEIVREICKVVLPRATWDDGHVQGGSRLCKVVRDKLDITKACNGVRVVGVYGVGGIGKTTLCKSLCKDFFMEFEGKVCHVELKDATSRLDLVREVLRSLMKPTTIVQGFNEDECCSLLRQNIDKHRVFVAIDNVSESSKALEDARFFLRLNYSLDSVVVVMARTLEQLRMLKIEEKSCLEMPELEKDEARSLFLYHVKYGRHVQFSQEIEADEESIEHCLRRCYFWKGYEDKHHYHPLALEVLGRQLEYKLEPWNVQLAELDGGDAFNQLRERGSQHPIFSILRSSYDALMDEDQLLFMDVAIFLPEDLLGRRTNVVKWLSLVHGVSVNVLKQRLMGLKRKSIIQEVGNTCIGMHDLWHEFAVMEMKVGDRERERWIHEVVDISALRSDGECGMVCARFGGGWANLQRICVMRTERSWMEMELFQRQLAMDDGDRGNVSYLKNALQIFKCGKALDQGSGQVSTQASLICVDEVDFRSCTNVTVVKLVRPMLKVLNLSGLQNLRSLEYVFGRSIYNCGDMRFKYSPLPRMEVRGLGGLSNLVVLLLDGIPRQSSWIGLIGGLLRLQVLRLDFCKPSNVFFTKEIGALKWEYKNRHPNLRRLWSLEHLTIHWLSNKAETKLGFSGRMGHLRIIDLSHCNFSRCDGVGDLIALERLDLSYCEKLNELPNVQRLVKLQRLDVSGCKLIRALPGLEALVALEFLSVDRCSKLISLPDLSKLIQLRSLSADRCSKLRSLPNLSKLIYLRWLSVNYCPMHLVFGLCNAISLRYILGITFEALEVYNDLQMLMELEIVYLKGWGSQGLPCLSTLPKLKVLFITNCKGMEVLMGLSNMTSLLRLYIWDCDFEDMSCVGHLSTLQILNISQCPKLKRLPNIHRLARLELLYISNCGSLRVWEGLRGSPLWNREDSWYRKSGTFSMLLEVLKLDGVPITELPEASSFLYFKKIRLRGLFNLPP